MATPRFHRAALLGLLAAAGAGCAGFGDAMTRGQRALDRGDYEAAHTAFNEAVAENDPETIVLALANRCIVNGALGTSGASDAAVADCTEALAKIDELGEPEGLRRAEVLNNRAVAYIRKRDPESAVADLDAAIELDPEYTEAYANRGRAYNDLEDFARAIEDLDRAAELNDQLSDVYGNRAYAHQSLGDLDAAYADYERAIAIDNNADAYFNRAMLRYTYGEFDGAYEDFKAVVRYAGPNQYNAVIAAQQAEFLENRPSVQATQTAAAGGSSDAPADADAAGDAPGDVADDPMADTTPTPGE